MAKFKKILESDILYGNKAVRTINIDQIVEIEDYSSNDKPHSRVKMSNGESFDVNKTSDDLVAYLNS